MSLQMSFDSYKPPSTVRKLTGFRFIIQGDINFKSKPFTSKYLISAFSPLEVTFENEDRCLTLVNLIPGLHFIHNLTCLKFRDEIQQASTNKLFADFKFKVHIQNKG